MNSYDIAEKHGMLDRGEIELLKSCALQLPPNPKIVNIGAGFGTSAAAILEERPDAFIWSVDKDPRPEERQNLKLCGLPENRCVRLLGKSWNVGAYFPYSVDMVFIDGDHGNEAVRADMEVWLPCMTDGGGIAVFHDYNHPNVPGLTVEVDRFMHGQKEIGRSRYMIAYWWSWSP